MRFPNKLVTFSVILMTTSAMAEAPCDYVSNDQVTFRGEIQSVKLMKKKVYPYIDDTRKCITHIKAKIKDKWYASSGQYTFGPDMSEKEACNHAEHRAKVKVMNERIPILLQSEKNVKCTLTKPKKSCKFIYMNAAVADFGKQRVRLRICDDDRNE